MCVLVLLFVLQRNGIDSVNVTQKDMCVCVLEQKKDSE